MLHDFLLTHRKTLIERAQVKVAARTIPRPTPEELAKGIPLFLDELIEIMRREPPASPGSRVQLTRSATLHGMNLLRQGFTIAQVVHDYGDLCQAVTELAGDLSVDIAPEEFQTFNGCLDSAIAAAVTEYGRQREESRSQQEVERLGVLAHELRNLLSTATIGFHSLRTGNVGIRGSTGGVVERALASLSQLIDRSLAEVRLSSKQVEHVHQPVRVAELMEDVVVSATIDATAHGVGLTVTSVPYEVFVKGDPHLLAAALSNLLTNAFKFTPRGGTVALSTLCAGGQVIITVEDQCGGLPAGAAEKMFSPFSQHSADRSGLGLGLTIAHRTVIGAGGDLRVRDIPGKGCVFTVELPEAGAEAYQSAPH